jgi:hypothetical protein
VIFKRFNVERAHREMGEAPPWQVMLHSPQHCECEWCSIARRHATYTVTAEDEPEDAFASALAEQTIRALRSGQSIPRVAREVRNIFRGRKDRR